jgi:hypothetical protein
MYVFTSCKLDLCFLVSCFEGIWSYVCLHAINFF